MRIFQCTHRPTIPFRNKLSQGYKTEMFYKKFQKVADFNAFDLKSKEDLI